MRHCIFTVIYFPLMEVILIILASLALFYILAIVCDSFFVPAIDILAKKMNLGSDAAGATLLAVGSSAPELFTSFFAVFGLAGAEANVGAGTIVGSAIFNILVIVGASAMFKAVVLQWQPVIRDLSFYVVTILLLFFSFRDGKVTLSEVLVFLAVYVVYIFAVVNWRKWFPYKDVAAPEEASGPPKNKIGNITFKALSFVIPDTNKKKHLYLVSFLMSIVVLLVISYYLVELITNLAIIMNINATFLALTVLAAGTSVPDLIGSIVVAKQGRGDMAVSNAVGSNIFDILFGLGLPWFLFLLINGGNIAVNNENLSASIILLFATVIAIIFLLIVRNWRIGHKSGLILIVLYVLYCIYTFITVA